MALLRIPPGRKKRNAAASRRSTTTQISSMALAGAVNAIKLSQRASTSSQDQTLPQSEPALKVEIVAQPQTVQPYRTPPTCEKLEKELASFSAQATLMEHRSSNKTTAPPSAERLIYLLSKLPYEIRLTIYELCIPCMWHRRRKILLDYISDCKWMAVSPKVFSEAAPLVLSTRVPYMYTSLAEGETATNLSGRHFERAFAEDSKWATAAARSLIEKMSITVRCPFFFDHSGDAKYDLALRLLAFFKTLAGFENLGALYVSLGPEYFPAGGSSPYFADTWRGEIEESTLRKLEDSAIVLKTVIPKACEVIWRFDKAAMPAPFYGLTAESEPCLTYLRLIDEAMTKYWSSEYLQQGYGQTHGAAYRAILEHKATDQHEHTALPDINY